MSSTSGKIDWGKFGLRSDTEKGVDERSSLKKHQEDSYYGARKEELFTAESGKEKESKPWWLITLFMSERTLFGTWDGVFTSCILNFIGAIIFLRTGWVVAQAGLIYSLLIVLTAVLIGVTTILSVIGILANADIQQGGVYYLISGVLGSRTGGAVGLIYCFGQIVGVSLSLVGFGESITKLTELNNLWLERAFATGALILLALVNFSGVKSVIKIQFIFLFFTIYSLIDFFIGVNLQHPEDTGFTGWSKTTWNGNLWPKYMSGYTWFAVLGVFFPSVTGLLAGVNMSADLRSPYRNISIGSVAALGISFLIYITLIFCLSGTVDRDVLRVDYLIMKEVSATGFLFLIGMYTSTLSSPLASLYGIPRILQSMALENVIPMMKALAMGKGPNKIPILSLLATVVVTFCFVLIGRLNILAPIVTLPFLITYTAIDYANFALQASIESLNSSHQKTPLLATSSFIGSQSGLTHSTDLDKLFPDRVTHKKIISRSRGSSESTTPEEENKDPKQIFTQETPDECFIGEGAEGENELAEASKQTSLPKQSVVMLILTNKWLSLLWAILKVIFIFIINWIYGLIALAIVLILYYYIAQTAPGAPPGIASNFKILIYLKYISFKIIGKSSGEYNEIIIPPQHPGVKVAASQLTSENKDFASRSKFHQSKDLVK